MLVIVSVVIGAALGARTARRRGGKGPDLAQYATGYAIAFGLAAWFVTLLIGRFV